MTEDMYVPPGIEIPRVLRGELSADERALALLSPAETMRAELELRYEVDSGRYEVARLALERSNRDREVSTVVLQTIRMQWMIREVVRSARVPAFASVDELELAVQPAYSLMTSSDERLPRAPYRSFDIGAEELMTAVALVYRVAEISNAEPAAAVGARLLMAKRTATNWIKRAREAGLLTTTLPAGEVDRRMAVVLAGIRARMDRELLDEAAAATRELRSGDRGNG